ncbi:ribonuclease III domain-containing protein [Lineolata rhizophorae]|uniref:Ribonuclease III domain-containing protein n=1 Tax=Lineolata rhizophorae TaxID=578093 RepID=A0A6A6NZS7_9PEZI|nr:ribonuclease III domain-containing protein [Lineolata rhizophorae]
MASLKRKRDLSDGEDMVLEAQYVLNRILEKGSALPPKAVHHARAALNALDHQPEQAAPITGDEPELLEMRQWLSNGPKFSTEEGEDAPQAGELPPLPHPPLTPAWEDCVFRHNSKARDDVHPLLQHYDRLELYGDALLQTFATEIIMRSTPNLPTGRQAFIREKLVQNKTLAEYSVAYGFHKKLKMSSTNATEEKRIKIMGDMFEAYVAAYMVANEDAWTEMENWLAKLWQPKFAEICKTVFKHPALKHPPKVELAKICNSKGISVFYEEEAARTSWNGNLVTTMSAYLTGHGYERLWLGTGEGLNKTDAGQNAALNALRNNKDLLVEVNKKKRETDTLNAGKKAENKRRESVKALDEDAE